MSLSDREKMVITFLKRKVPPKKIADELGMSLRDVYKIKGKKFGKNKAELTNELKAVKLYTVGKLPVEVAIKLRIPLDEALQYYLKYNDTDFHLGEFGKAYHMVKGQGQLKELLDICEAMKMENMTAKDMVNAYQMHGDLAEMEDRLLVLARETEFYKGKKNIVLSELDQAETKLTRINSNIQVGNAEIARIKNSLQAYNNQNQNNTTYPNQIYPNYYNSGIKWGANVRYY